MSILMHQQIMSTFFFEGGCRRNMVEIVDENEHSATGTIGEVPCCDRSPHKAGVLLLDACKKKHSSNDILGNSPCPLEEKVQDKLPL